MYFMLRLLTLILQAPTLNHSAQPRRASEGGEEWHDEDWEESWDSQAAHGSSQAQAAWPKRKAAKSGCTQLVRVLLCIQIRESENLRKESRKEKNLFGKLY